MKIIFLDIDGVLNHEDFYERRMIAQRKGESFPHYNIDPQSMSLLNEFVGEYDIKIVISSTWRADGVEALQEIFDKYGDNFDIIGATPYITHLAAQRGNEIFAWIMNNRKVIGQSYFDYKNYVILDDDDDMLYQQKDNFIHVDTKHGLNTTVILKMKEVLNLN